MPMMRGAKPSPRHKLLGARPFRPTKAAPPQFCVVPKQLSVWGNDQYGDCVTADEAYAKAAYSVMCGLPETFVTEDAVISWARKHGFLNGAYLTEVMDVMAREGLPAGGTLYEDGPYSAVDYSNEFILQGALAVGPVKIGIDAGALPSGAGNHQGWFATNGGRYPNEDHCVALTGYGPASYLYQCLGVPLPAGLAPTTPGYLLFTWGTIGFVTHAWLMGTCAEAWLRNPTTPGQSPTPPTPPVVYVAPFCLFEGAEQVGLATGYLTQSEAHSAATVCMLRDGVPVTVKDAAGAVVETVSPAPPPPPPPLHVIGTAIGTIHIPGGLGAKNVNVSLPVTGTAQGPHGEAAFPWMELYGIFLKITPIVVAGIQAGKQFSEIMQDVLAALGGKIGAQKLTPEQWAKIIQFVIQMIALFGGV